MLLRPALFRSALWVTTAAAVLAIAPSAEASLIVNDATPYTQDFDFLSTSSGVVWVDDQATESTTGSPGWLWQSDGGDQPYDASAGGNATGSPYSYGDVGDSDRAMGNLGGGDNDNTAWGLVIQNGSSDWLTSVTVEFAAEQWRSPTSNPPSSDSQVVFSHRQFTTEPSDLQIDDGDVPSGWTQSLDLTFGVISATGSGAVDGNSATYSDALSADLDVNVAPGEYIAFRWYSQDESGFDYGLAIDDLRLSFTLSSIPEPTATLFGGLVSLGLATSVRRRWRDAA